MRLAALSRSRAIVVRPRWRLSLLAVDKKKPGGEAWSAHDAVALCAHADIVSQICAATVDGRAIGAPIHANDHNLASGLKLARPVDASKPHALRLSHLQIVRGDIPASTGTAVVEDDDSFIVNDKKIAKRPGVMKRAYAVQLQAHLRELEKATHHKYKLTPSLISDTVAFRFSDLDGAVLPTMLTNDTYMTRIFNKIESTHTEVKVNR